MYIHICTPNEWRRENGARMGRNHARDSHSSKKLCQMIRWPDPRRYCYLSSESPWCSFCFQQPNQLLDNPRTYVLSNFGTTILRTFFCESLSRVMQTYTHVAGRSGVAAAALPPTRTHLPLCETTLFSLMTTTTLYHPGTLQVPSGGTALSFVPAVFSAYCAFLLLLENPEHLSQPTSEFVSLGEGDRMLLLLYPISHTPSSRWRRRLRTKKKRCGLQTSPG